LPVTKLRVAIAGVGIGRAQSEAFRKLPGSSTWLRCAIPMSSGATPSRANRHRANDHDFDDLPGETMSMSSISARRKVCTTARRSYSPRQARDLRKPVVGLLADCDALIDGGASGRAMPVYQYRFEPASEAPPPDRPRRTGKHYLSTAETTWRRGPAYFKPHGGESFAGDGAACSRKRSTRTMR
jgi:hypothetical protein